MFLRAARCFLDWQIGPSGTVFEAGVVRDEFSNKEFQKCLGANISPETPSTLNTPFSSGRKINNKTIQFIDINPRLF